MYYQNGNYMQDLNYYNQNPNMVYTPCTANRFQNQNMNMNAQMPMGQIGQQNLNAMYPAVYRIISPVVSQVLANNHTGYLTEDVLDNMVDTVYHIVEGDINLNHNANPTTQSSSNSNESSCGRTTSNSTPSSNSTSATTSTTNGQNTLLRDLIKIMLLNEIMARRQNSARQMMMQNANMFM